MKPLQLAFVALFCLAAAYAAAEERQSVSPGRPITYQSFGMEKLSRTPWQGEHVALLLPNDGYEEEDAPAAISSMLAALDRAYEYYEAATGRKPGRNPQGMYRGKLAVAVVKDPSYDSSRELAGRGNVGVCGIEIREEWFAGSYQNVRQHQLYGWVEFYELGRNFWFYDDQLTYKESDPDYGIRQGYAVFMCYKAMEAAGVQGARSSGSSFEDLKNGIRKLIDIYAADESLNWENSLRSDQFKTSEKMLREIPNVYARLNSGDLFASFLFRLEEQSGNEEFVKELWHAAGKAPAAKTTQDAVDNFILCASVASKKDLSDQFEAWKWPTLSQRAEAWMAALEQNDWKPLTASGAKRRAAKRR